jgi:hypothetical protein
VLPCGAFQEGQVYIQIRVFADNLPKPVEAEWMFHIVRGQYPWVIESEG